MVRSLDRLRIFDAAARHLSFKAAASELNVTPAAVSQRIRQLEAELRVDLFERSARQVSLTPDGSALAQDVRRAIQLLELAVDSVRQRDAERPVVITTTPTFAEQVLLPALGDLQERISRQSVRVVVSSDLVDPGSQGVDIAIRQGLGSYPDFDVRRLLTCTYAPVCAPRVVDRWRSLSTIHVDWPARVTVPPNWRKWRESTEEQFDAGRGDVHVATEAMAIRAALCGHGIALVAIELVQAELSTGALVRPFGEAGAMKSEHNYYLVKSPHRARAGVREVSDWLLNRLMDQVASPS